jgi:hypothetical protein
METRAQRTERLHNLSARFEVSSNAGMLEIIRETKMVSFDYSCVIGIVSESTADRLSYAWALCQCERSGDTTHKWAPGAPNAWKQHHSFLN